MFMKVHMCWYKYDLKLKTFTQNIFHTSEFSDDPSSFIIECDNISGRDLWYTWPENRLEHKRPSSTSSEVSDYIHIEYPGHHIEFVEVKILDREPHWFKRGVKEAIYIKADKPTLNNDGGRYKLPGAYESILRSSVPKVTTWDILILDDEKRRIVWKFRGTENILCWDQKY